ncbi:hypothetical protein [Thiothrix fructosivorans]|uniref:Uncharacterized protein n=1 Tax=Thiothrix fructosivorans TaxID=111770 RepID=A0A8B0SPQ6_9GAMM|nr:hypothetical protein [Thiothrix fructosivorans]QTX13021.1 hypothetical protein J1836_020125 [Thiothrix fructosivorans]
MAEDFTHAHAANATGFCTVKHITQFANGKLLLFLVFANQVTDVLANIASGFTCNITIIQEAGRRKLFHARVKAMQTPDIKHTTPP